MRESFELKIPYDTIRDQLCKLGAATQNDPKLVVTGDFDNWKGTDSTYVLRLDNKRNLFSVNVPFIEDKEQVSFKLIINDMSWITLDSFETVIDESGNLNNVVYFNDYIIEVSNRKKEKEKIINLRPTISNNEYVNISSFSELSSTEEIIIEDEFNEQELDQERGSTYQVHSEEFYNLEDTLQDNATLTKPYLSSKMNNEKPLPFLGFLGISNKVKTYWKK